MADIFEIGTAVLMAVVFIACFWMIGAQIISARLVPLAESLNPQQSVGITGEQYSSIVSHIDAGWKAFIIIAIAVPFVYLIFKLFYERERTSVAYG